MSVVRCDKLFYGGTYGCSRPKGHSGLCNGDNPKTNHHFTGEPKPKCINHKKRYSISVEENGIPHLCKQCWDSQGMSVKKGDRVICTVSHPSCDGLVERIVDGLAVTKTDDGGESWNPIQLLVKSI